METDLLLTDCETLSKMHLFHKKPPEGTYVIVGWLRFIGSLDTVSEKAEDSTDPQQHGETAKQLSTRKNNVEASRPVQLVTINE